ncbi:hypothetical protein [Nonomuraea pusilla]|uniref:Molybdopterin converting factor, small subunit n=1 Tax=Nonomuraea pusilla TaxID=46177 RepID=A0A1H7T9M9_9ACTN|nr:hypothetical protein [Nonomuraea pusilla]SEL81199.1 hypothetical protein SAMN05660976_03394 [Nonomuraea pusilla]
MAPYVTMVVFVLPGPLRRWVSGRAEVKVFAVGADRESPPTLRAALDRLRRTHPQLEARLRDEYGRIRRHIAMVVCGENSGGLGELDCALPPGAQVYVLPALSA